MAKNKQKRKAEKDDIVQNALNEKAFKSNNLSNKGEEQDACDV